MSDNRSANTQWPMDRDISFCSWGIHPENGDCLSLVKVGDAGCVRLYAAQTFHGDHDTTWVIEVRSDGTERWHRADSIDTIEWKP